MLSWLSSGATHSTHIFTDRACAAAAALINLRGLSLILQAGLVNASIQDKIVSGVLLEGRKSFPHSRFEQEIGMDHGKSLLVSVVYRSKHDQNTLFPPLCFFC